MWCKNLNMCIDRNAYLASFPYGQCMDWTTKADECPLAPSKNDSKVTIISKSYPLTRDCTENITGEDTVTGESASFHRLRNFHR